MQPADRQRYIRRVIRIRAEDSPNVRLAQAEIAVGLEPSLREIVPGVVNYEQFVQRTITWDEILQCIGLHAQFYEGKEALMYPPLWLNRAAELERVRLCQSYPAETIGIDPGEGTAFTSFAAINKYGVKDLVSIKTPDTSDIIGQSIAFIKEHRVLPQKVAFDRGGGGKQIADLIRKMGYPVKTVAFGENVTLDPRRGLHLIKDRIENIEERYACFNRRSEMYDNLRNLLDPTRIDSRGQPISYGFAIPSSSNPDSPYTRLRKELAPIPRKFDKEGRLKLPPKNKTSANSNEKSLVEMIGFSPDEADAVVLGVHMMVNRTVTVMAGVLK